MLDSRLSEMFMVLAEELHFGRAAQRLFMTQPPLSQNIRRLEEQLGATLFERSTRSVRLTAAGQELQRRLRFLAMEHAHTVQAVQQIHRGQAGVLRLALTPSSAYAEVSRLLYSFRQQYPHVLLQVLEFNSRDMPAALYDGQFDIGFIRPSFADADMNPELVSTEPMRFVVRHDDTRALTYEQGISLEQVFSYELLSYSRENSRYFCQLVNSMAARSGREPKFAQESLIPTILTLVEAGIAPALVPASLARLRKDTLTYLPLLDADEFQAQIMSVYLSDNHNPAIPHFLAILRGQ
ncbi:LysR family transcriptional regulator [Alcaligenes endophyticus]|uniref:LysR family transcriptional regulator n=1 Tax=Alcaligenes endophyticus TaxID=1929088 RepID=A0ABT8ELW8_9BURK|nr:LysR substrate-binding domain-containing protein [Alcaligenes endophyticus]MCX5591126.1 LysR substrate-binding domain-containing protein [Alcaligenes endophyticus]MDN4122296.1 LysR family transcriptional regulator [Alcaligenes endophyticus]